MERCVIRDLPSHQRLLAVACAWTNPTRSLVVCVTHACTKSVNPSFWCVTCKYCIAKEIRILSVVIAIEIGIYASTTLYGAPSHNLPKLHNRGGVG